jgi:hypothetical protein
VSASVICNSKAHGFGSAGFHACALISLSVLLSACASGAPVARTTFLDSIDLIEMTDRMAQSFSAHEAIASRRPESERWVISMNRIENHTNQIIPDREKWLYVARLRALLDRGALARSKNLTWIIPPERWSMLQDELGPEPAALRLLPTHQLTGEFTALTSTSGHGRSDAYLAEYHLFDLVDGRLIWSDHWEVKRAISGRTYD